MAIELALAAYKNRSTIIRFIKWLAIAICAFVFFAYLVIATVFTVISNGFQPLPKVAGPSVSQVKH